jgi:5'(3')-deoxyribonucleotidase
MGYDVWIATKPPTGVSGAYSDKAEWVFKHLPELTKKIIITHDKGLLGNSRDFLIDDRPHKANCHEFEGTLLHFGNNLTWPEVINILKTKFLLKE